MATDLLSHLDNISQRGVVSHQPGKVRVRFLRFSLREPAIAPHLLAGATVGRLSPFFKREV